MIEIDIKDFRHYTDVVIVVDRDDFKQEIDRIIEVLKNKSLYSLPDNIMLTKEQEAIIDEEIESARKALFLPIVFRPVISAVVFRNKITDKDYSPAYLISDWKGETFDKKGETPDETYYIVLSPGVTNEDVEYVLSKYREQINNIKGVPYYKYIHSPWSYTKKQPAIVKHRKWYFQNQDGKSIAEICNDEIFNCPVSSIDEDHNSSRKRIKGCTCYTKKTISNGIKKYASLLGKTPTF